MSTSLAHNDWKNPAYKVFHGWLKLPTFLKYVYLL
jgi:hypothetical protein